MREIKFRAWDKAKKEMFYQGNTVDENRALFWKRWEITTGPHDPMQYTGLKDNCGVEIFEDDILSGNGKNHWIVKFIDGAFVGVPNEGNIKLFKYNFIALYFTESKVFGNIHKNPELLT